MLSRGDGFFHVTKQDVQGFLPAALASKWDSALAIISGSSSPDGALVIIGHRIDEPAGKLDHHPFAVAVSGSDPASSGIFVDHLSTLSRSIDLPSGFSAGFWSSGMSNYYERNPPFGLASGSLPQLPAPAKAALGVVLGLIPRPSSSLSNRGHR
jgi:hypothetical protein